MHLLRRMTPRDVCLLSIATALGRHSAVLRSAQKLRWGIVLLACSALHTATGSSIPGFTAHGQLTYTNYLVASEHYTIDYTVYAKPPYWKITAHQFGERRFGYTEHGYDGTNLYSITYYNKEPLFEARAKTNLSYFVNGKVLPEKIPSFDPVRSIHIWFAYIGLQHASEKDLTIVGCKLTSGRPITQCYRTIVCTTNTDQALGLRLVSGSVDDAGYDYDVDGNAIRLQSPLDRGYTPLVFEVAYPDSANQAVPNHFAFTARIPRIGAVAGELTDVWTLKGETISTHNGVTLRDFRPEIIDRAYVWDYVRNVEYITKSGWIEPGSPSFDTLMERRKANQHRPPSRGAVVLICIGFITIAPLAFLLVRMVKGRKS